MFVVDESLSILKSNDWIPFWGFGNLRYFNKEILKDIWEGPGPSNILTWGAFTISEELKETTAAIQKNKSRSAAHISMQAFISGSFMAVSTHCFLRGKLYLFYFPDMNWRSSSGYCDIYLFSITKTFDSWCKWGGCIYIVTCIVEYVLYWWSSGELLTDSLLELYAIFLIAITHRHHRDWRLI